MHSLITSALVRATRQVAGRYIWTHPSIAQTFRCRPAYQASFKKTWLSLMWGGEAGTSAIAGVDRRGDFGGQSVLLLNVRASALPAGCRIRFR